MPVYFRDAPACAEFTPEKMCKVNLFSTPQLFCDVYGLLPGQEQKPHAHAANDKIYHVLAGIVRVQVGGQERTLAAGETAHAPAGIEHGVRNDSELPASLLVVMAPHPNPVAKPL